MKKKLMIGCGGFIALIMFMILVFGIVLWNQRGEAVDLETQIDTQYKANKSNYDAMWKRFTEMAQVSEMQAEQFKDVYTDLVEGRNKDTKLLFKAVQEQNPQLDGKVYTNLQKEISVARTDFDWNQRRMLDIIGEYNRLVQHRGIIMATITNRKPINGDEYLVLSDKTDKAFESGKDDQINLKGDK